MSQYSQLDKLSTSWHLIDLGLQSVLKSVTISQMKEAVAESKLWCCCVCVCCTACCDLFACVKQCVSALALPVSFQPVCFLCILNVCK